MVKKKIKDKSNLKKLKRDIQKWKEEGYEIDDIERLVDFAKKHEKPKEIRIIVKTVVISIIIALFLIFLTIVAGSLVINQFAFGNVSEYKGINGSIGFPLEWLYLSYNYYSHPNSGTIEVSSWMNLITNLVIYMIITISILYFPRFIIKIFKDRI